MPTYAELPVGRTLVEGYAAQVGWDRATGGFDGGAITPARESAARALLARRLVDPKVPGLAQYVTRYASQSAMLDAVADSTAAAGLSDLLALAAVVVTAQNRSLDPRGGDLYLTIAERAEKELAIALRGFVPIASAAIGAATATGGFGGGALVSVY